MTEIENIKHNWAALPIENEILQRKNLELTRELSKQKIRSHQEKLAGAYRIGYVGFLFPGLALLMRLVVGMSVGLCVFYSLFGIFTGLYDIWFMRYVRKTDYMSMPVVEAVAQASKVIRYQNWSTVIGIVAAALLLVPMFYEMSYIDMDIFWGGVVGGVVGGVFGTVKCVQNHRHARQMLREIESPIR